jgi:serine protease
VTQHESEGAGWLHASTDGSNATTNAQEIVITVTRAQMADGVYHGLVSVNADGLTPGIIAVSMTVAPVTRPGEVVYVLAIDPATMQPVAQASTTAEGSFGYHLDALPPGNYLIYAGTDRNGDGYIGDAGDLCGALPTLASPTPLTVSAGDWLLDIDFPIAELWSADGPPQTVHLPLMP